MSDTQALSYSELHTISDADIAQINELIITTWDYRSWIPKEKVLPMAEFLLDDVILTSSRIFVVRDGDTIAGIMAVTASADLQEKVRAKTRQYSALKNIIARDPQEETLFDMYLNTLIINGNLLASCDGNFDASLNLFMIDARFRGQGIGNRLWQLAMGYLREKQSARYFLWTDSDSDFGFYEHKGLQRIAAQAYDWGGHDVTETYYVYAGELPALS
ncbi:GNAT family N-acetyltransferase [Morganella morganii]|uniref:GNAT family N-acetyltransferase n=1 Tax=Morganella morganii TaxID=582 RepID=A0AAI9HNX1_MORMO|nr:GNAT family N-acetyltransferase [Morganella morganii]EKW8759443.1 GNAT family N-acetyltransferase [Morganella morganii]SHL36779.1 Acetyltransferase (GNAT) domain-containing protein [Morganella morganii]HAS8351377.1 GNAT family N-acetyltransferase [Vibrio vulnificus]HCE8948723.1 GNAT family N-acetyltransferase [Morganella morganii]